MKSPRTHRAPTRVITMLLALAGSFTAALTNTLRADTLHVPAEYQSIQAAIDAARDGDIVLIAPGTYFGQLLIADKAITLASWFYTTGDPVYIDQTILDGETAQEIVVYEKGINGQNYFIGLTARNAAQDGLLVASPISVLFSRITDTRDAIDFESGAFNSLIRGSLIDNNRDDAVDFDGTSYGIVEHNRLIDNKDDGIEIRFPDNIKITPAAYTIRNNIISGNGEDAIQMIGHDSGVSNRVVIISHNLIADNAMAGVGLMCCSETNELYEGAPLPERHLIYNNTFRNNNHGIVGGDNTIVVNNIFTGHEVAVKRLHANSIAAYNIFHQNIRFVLDSIVDIPSSLNVDPLLAADSSLLPGSPAVDRGTAAYTWQGEQHLDLAAETYTGTAPDMGAFEINGAYPWNMPPFVNAGESIYLPAPGSVQLSGVFYDDGIPAAAEFNWRDADETGAVSFADPSVIATDVSFAAAGNYRLILEVSDGELSASSEVAVQVGGSNTTLAEYVISTGADDAEEDAGSGAVTTKSSDLEMSFDPAINGDQLVALRFNNIAIQPGATILTAHVQFRADETDTNPANLTVEAHATGNAPPLTTAAGNISARPRTAASVTWTPDAWDQAGAAGAAQQTPELLSLIQELVNRPDWTAGNSIALIISGSGRRVADSYEGSASNAARLVIGYSNARANTAPAVTITEPTPNSIFGTNDPITFSATATDREDDDQNLLITWSSSLSGFLGTGSSISGTLPPGTHLVSARTIDSGGLAANTSVTVSVTVPGNNIPGVIIDYPADGSVYAAGTTVALGGTASDTEDGDISADINWRSSLDHTLGTGNTVSAVLSPGNHIITAEVSDSSGQSAASTVNITIGLPSNSSPAVFINLPSGGDTFIAGDLIRLMGIANDFEDGEISSAIVWSSSIDGTLGNGPTLTPALSVGIHSLEARVTDSDGATSSTAIYIEVRPADDGGGGTVALVAEVRIASGSDDAEQSEGGSVDLTSTDLEMVYDSGNQLVGLRFTALDIAPGALIQSAYLQFTSDEVTRDPTALLIAGQASDNPDTFTTTRFDISNRPTTAATATWSPPAWTQNGQAGTQHRSGNLALIIQEIINRPGWAAGNALVLIISGTGERVARSWNGVATAAPLLHIDFDVPAGNRPPQVSITAPENGTTITEGTPLSFSATAADDEDGDLGSTVTWVSSVSGTFPDSGSSIAATLAAGTHVITASSVDSAGQASSDSVTVAVTPAGGVMQTLDRQIAASTDDAEERATGSVYLDSTDLELIYDSNAQTVGLRFTNIGIEPDAVISNAWIQFTTDELSSAQTDLILEGEAVADAATFNTASYNISSRPRTQAKVNWSPPAWSTFREADTAQRTPNIANIVAEIINGPDWVSGNALAIILTGNGKRVAEASNGVASAAPILHIEYMN